MTAIGVFDSGVGGLTVLRALRQALPQESFIYLGDTARLPYGAKSPDTIRRYLQQNMDFLTNLGVKAMVVACNSASTVLQQSLWGERPIYGVIEPGARAATMKSQNHRIGVLGTRATVESEAYAKAVHRRKPEVDVIQQACPLLVPLVEEGWETDDITIDILRRYLAEPLAHGVDTLILGCTHYPVLKQQIQQLVGPDIALVDSAEVVAGQLVKDIRDGRIQPGSGDGELHIWTTDTNHAFQEVGRRILQPFTADAWNLADLQSSAREYA